jgi:hypothetical protein
MKLKSLLNKKIKKEKSDEKNKISAFKKFLVVSTVLLTSCGAGGNIDSYDKWEQQDTEVSDEDNLEDKKESFCNNSILNEPFSSNVSLKVNESIYLFNRTKITFEGKKNNLFTFYIEPENSKPYYLELNKNKNINENNETNYLEICSYDLNENTIHLASDEVFLNFIFNGERTEIIEKNNGEYEQLIERTYALIEGNSKVNELLFYEKNWTFPNLKENESNTIIWFNEFPYVFNNYSEDLIYLFDYDSYLPLMNEGTSFLYDSKITITLSSIIEDKGNNYFVFELKSDEESKKIFFPEKTFYSFNFDGREMTFFVENKSSLGVTFYKVTEFFKITYTGNQINIKVNGINSNADVNFSHWDNVTKIEMYPKYNLMELVKEKEE